MFDTPQYPLGGEPLEIKWEGEFPNQKVYVMIPESLNENSNEWGYMQIVGQWIARLMEHLGEKLAENMTLYGQRNDDIGEAEWRLEQAEIDGNPVEIMLATESLKMRKAFWAGGELAKEIERKRQIDEWKTDYAALIESQKTQ